MYQKIAVFQNINYSNKALINRNIICFIILFMFCEMFKNSVQMQTNAGKYIQN